MRYFIFLLNGIFSRNISAVSDREMSTEDCHVSEKNPGLTDLSVRGVFRK